MAASSKTSKRVIDTDRLLEVGNEIMNAINANELALTSDGPIMSVVKYADGSYRKKLIGSNWDFFLESCYVGSSGNLIFVMSTLDQPAFDTNGEPAKLWASAEFNPAAIDATFPMLLVDLSKFIDVGSSMVATVEHLYNRKVVAAQIEEGESHERLRDLPTFGMF